MRSTHFQGVATHELGHWIKLDDLGPGYRFPCTGGTGIETMCGVVNGYPDSYRLKTLTDDDKQGANGVY